MPDHRKKIGWVMGEELYLDFNIAFAAAQNLAKDQGTSFPIGQHTLLKRLDEKGYLASKEGERNSLRIRLMIEGARRAVVHIKKDALPIRITDPTNPNDPDEF